MRIAAKGRAITGAVAGVLARGAETVAAARWAVARAGRGVFTGGGTKAVVAARGTVRRTGHDIFVAVAESVAASSGAILCAALPSLAVVAGRVAAPWRRAPRHAIGCASRARFARAADEVSAARRWARAGSPAAEWAHDERRNHRRNWLGPRVGGARRDQCRDDEQPNSHGRAADSQGAAVRVLDVVKHACPVRLGGECSNGAAKRETVSWVAVPQSECAWQAENC